MSRRKGNLGLKLARKRIADARGAARNLIHAMNAVSEVLDGTGFDPIVADTTRFCTDVQNLLTHIENGLSKMDRRRKGSDPNR